MSPTPKNEHSKRDSVASGQSTGASPQLPAAGDRPRRKYEPPRILSHSGEEILEELGPAQACYPFQSCGIAV